MPRDRTPLNAIRAFEAAARHGNLAGAAGELAVTSGAVSQQVLALERALGVPLFERTSRRLVLTFEGRRLADRTGAALDQIDAAVREARAVTTPDVLRLRMTPTLAARWLMPLLADFAGRHPQMNVELTTNIVQGSEPLLDGVDFAIRLGLGALPGEDAMLLFGDALAPVCTPRIAERLRTPDDLAQVPLLHSMLRPESWPIWLQAAGCSAVVDGSAGLRFAHAELAYQAAIEGVGVAVAQMAYVQSELRSGRLVRPFEQVATTPLGYQLVHASARAQWPKVRLFKAWMAEMLALRGGDAAAGL